MTGILLITHAPLGSALIDIVRHVFGGHPAHLEAIDVVPDQPIGEVIQSAQEAITRLDSGMGILILTDMVGATPANCCQQLSTADQVRVLAGLNLPMLLRALNYRNKGLEVVFEMARTGAQSSIVEVEPKFT